VLRKSFAFPAAAILALSGAGGLAHQFGTVRAQTSRDNFVGTISISDYQVPNALGAGNAGASVVNAELIPATTDFATTFDQHGNFLPDIATVVPSTTNGGIKVANGDEIITYHLKPNQKWSDGSPVLPADYLFNFPLQFAPDNGAVDPANYVKQAYMSGNELVLHLRGVLGSALQQLNYLTSPTPTAYMQKKYGVTLSPSLLRTWDYAKEIDAKTGLIPESVYESSGLKKFTQAWLQDHYTSPSDLFDGPYKVETWSPDQRYVLVANPFYNLLPPDPNHPRPQRIQFVVLSEDGSTYVQDIKAGSTYNGIDKAEDFTIDNVPDLKSTKYNTIVEPALQYELLDLMSGPTYNGQPNPLHDLRVRQAVQDAIDKVAYTRYLFGNAVGDTFARSMALNSFIPSSSPWSYDKSLPNAYNPAKARALLANAGYATTLGTGSNHLTLDFVTTTKTSRIKGAQLLQRFLNQVGISLRIRYAPAHGVNALFGTWQDGGIETRHTFQIALHGFQTNPDPDEAYLNYAPDQISSASNPNGANANYVDDPKLDKLFIAGRNTLDDAARHRIYDLAQAYFYNQAYAISLYTNPNVLVSKGTVGNFKPNSTQTGHEWNTFQWWYDSSNSQKPLLN
jgi:ABC-type transport system substrate-binding protein